MGFLSSLFGKSEKDEALEGLMKHVKQILEDEEYQLSLINPAVRELIEKGHNYDKDPGGSGPFGMVETNPIPVNGPIGEMAYLSKLETKKGERILFHRIGAINTFDVFEATTFSGSEWFIFFLDCYHPRKSKMTPEGFNFLKDIGQLSGFNKFDSNFPYNFVEMKHTERESGLSMAYIAIDRVTSQIDNRSFNRPIPHKVKLDLVKSKLTSMQT